LNAYSSPDQSSATPVTADDVIDPQARGYVFARSVDFLINSMKALSAPFEGDVTTALVFHAMSRASVAHMNMRPGVNKAAVDGIFPDDLRRSVSILSTANFLGLPYETTRRHVGKLVELGLVERRGSREFFVSSAVLARPAFDPVATQTVNLARILMRDTSGVFEPGQMVEA